MTLNKETFQNIISLNKFKKHKKNKQILFQKKEKKKNRENTNNFRMKIKQPYCLNT